MLSKEHAIVNHECGSNLDPQVAQSLQKFAEAGAKQARHPSTASRQDQWRDTLGGYIRNRRRG